MNLRKIFQSLSNLSIRKRELRNKLHQNGDRLRPGLWLLQDATIARHIGIRGVPGEIVASKSTGQQGTSWFFLSVRRIALQLVYPAVCRIPGNDEYVEEDQDRTGRSVAVLSKAGKLLIFDQEAMQVIHIAESAIWDDEWMRIVRQLGEHLRIPAFSVDSDRSLLIEEWLAGWPLGQSSNERRKTVINELIEKLVRLHSASASSPDPGFWEKVTKHWQSLPLPAEVTEYLASNWSRIRPVAESLQFMPAHGDLSGKNVLVDADSWCLIDLEDCCRMPAFFDVFFLAHQEAVAGRDDIWEGLFKSGHFPGYGAKFAQGLFTPDSLSLTDWGIAMLLAECFIWQEKSGAPALNERLLAQWWRPVMKDWAERDRP